MIPHSDHLTPAEMASMAHADHNDVIALARKEQNALFEAHPQFAAYCEDEDPSVCPIAILVDMIRRAPETGLRMKLLQVYELREEMAQLTGRSFS